eukprot:SAG31_NODE_5447_length_2532_cov_17.404439_3_plen_226_part_00
MRYDLARYATQVGVNLVTAASQEEDAHLASTSSGVRTRADVGVCAHGYIEGSDEETDEEEDAGRGRKQRVAKAKRKSQRFKGKIEGPNGEEGWSPFSLVEAFALKKGLYTRGGRTDVHRAANMLLRLALDSKRSAGGGLLWFEPPMPPNERMCDMNSETGHAQAASTDHETAEALARPASPIAATRGDSYTVGCVVASSAVDPPTTVGSKMQSTGAETEVCAASP